MVRTFLLVLLLFTLLAGCATAPRVGIRKAYQGRRISEIAIAPTWSSSHFGIDAAQWNTVADTYGQQIRTELKSLGFRIETPDQLRTRLKQRGTWNRFDDMFGVLDMRHGIGDYFEPSAQDAEPREVTLLKALHTDGSVDAPALLISEIAYQTTGVCTDDPREHSKLATVVVDGKPAKRSSPPSRPCVVSHFEAKLVDTATGRTMWTNGNLREVRQKQLTPDTRTATIRRAVHATLSGGHGLGPFVPTAAVASRR